MVDILDILIGQIDISDCKVPLQSVGVGRGSDDHGTETGYTGVDKHQYVGEITFWKQHVRTLWLCSKPRGLVRVPSSTSLQ